MGKFEHLRERIGLFKIVCCGLAVKPPDLCNLAPLILFIFMMSVPIFSFVTWSFKNYIVSIVLSLTYFTFILLTYIFMFICSFTEPGIIPKNLVEFEKETPNQIKIHNSE